MRLLVTGGVGNIGTHVLKTLNSTYLEDYLVCVDSQTYASNYEFITYSEKLLNYRFEKVDEYNGKNYDSVIHRLFKALDIDRQVAPILSENDKNLIDYSDFKFSF